MTSDIRLLQKIQTTAKGASHILIDIGLARVYTENEGFDDRKVRISSGAVEEMQKCGWEIKGNFKLVDQHHRFADETDGSDGYTKLRKMGLRVALYVSLVFSQLSGGGDRGNRTRNAIPDPR